MYIGAPKFPTPVSLNFLLYYHQLLNNIHRLDPAKLHAVIKIWEGADAGNEKDFRTVATRLESHAQLSLDMLALTLKV
jgi:hypothetical protein